MFAVENLACIRAERLLFSHLGFSLQPGSLLLLKGANGVGKTSLIKILTGLGAPSEGKVTWMGENIAGNFDFRRDMKYIGHKSGVKADCTVEENIAYWARMYGTTELISAALQFYDLQKFRHAYAGQLSAGWQRRVALARLIVVPCRMWILDEPTNFLDEEAVMLTATLIETRVTQGGIVVVASHIMNSAIAAHTLYL
ncbi:MAG: cytochrome c biogenesis heme-transporting ATPase CcmA, partial [Proteobacteria bacterium]|nr:cytochrome c biogenesis heme-transporting ATPase CcmA [Pseudomonadota bacterium]